MTTKEPTIAIGKTRAGFSTSPARVVTESKPMKEKKTVEAPGDVRSS